MLAPTHLQEDEGEAQPYSTLALPTPSRGNGPPPARAGPAPSVSGGWRCGGGLLCHCLVPVLGHLQHLVPSHPLGWAPQELALEALEREVSVQPQIAAAARRLALAPELSTEQRRRRRQVQADALRRLHELEEQLGDVRARLGLPGLQPPQPLPLSSGAVITAQGVCLGTRLAQLSQGEHGPVIPLVKVGGWALAQGRGRGGVGERPGQSGRKAELQGPSQ